MRGTEKPIAVRPPGPSDGDGLNSFPAETGGISGNAETSGDEAGPV